MENKGNKRPEAVFISSSAHFRELPAPRGEEYAVMGRSNVGKSSFINHVLENKGLAPGFQNREKLLWLIITR